MFKQIAVRSISCALFLGIASAASAGGLFGEGGAFRGTVGNFIGNNFESTVMTPLARRATNEAAGALGSYIAGPFGSQVGSRIVGPGINNRAAGKGGFRSAQPRRGPADNRPGLNRRSPNVRFGTVCRTNVVTVPMMTHMPVGARCTAFTIYGPMPGIVM